MAIKNVLYLLNLQCIVTIIGTLQETATKTFHIECNFLFKLYFTESLFLSKYSVIGVHVKVNNTTLYDTLLKKCNKKKKQYNIIEHLKKKKKKNSELATAGIHVKYVGRVLCYDIIQVYTHICRCVRSQRSSVVTHAHYATYYTW